MIALRNCTDLKSIHSRPRIRYANRQKRAPIRQKRAPITTPDFFEQKPPGLRDDLGWTQAELAAFLGVTHSVPAVWEDPGGDGPTSEAVRAALLALRLARGPERGQYPGSDQPMEKLREEGLSAFYREAACLEVR